MAGNTTLYTRASYSMRTLQRTRRKPRIIYTVWGFMSEDLFRYRHVFLGDKGKVLDIVITYLKIILHPGMGVYTLFLGLSHLFFR